MHGIERLRTMAVAAFHYRALRSRNARQRFATADSRRFALSISSLLSYFVLFAFDFYALALDVEPQAVEYRDVLVRDPDQGEEAEDRSAPILIDQTEVGD